MLPYKKVYEKKLYEINYNEDLNKLGYDLIDNTEEEIYNCTIEMIEMLYNKTISEKKNQNNFWKIHQDYFQWKPKLMRIGNSFFNDNLDLFC